MGAIHTGDFKWRLVCCSCVAFVKLLDARVWCVLLEFQSLAPRSQQDHLNKTICVWVQLSSVISYVEKQCKSRKLWRSLTLNIARELF